MHISHNVILRKHVDEHTIAWQRDKKGLREPTRTGETSAQPTPQTAHDALRRRLPCRINGACRKNFEAGEPRYRWVNWTSVRRDISERM
jgi:hypothetical protein